MNLLNRSSFLTLAAVASTAMSLQASVLLYEGFGYGLADNANINGAAATGTGVSGSWTVNNSFGTFGSASSVYKTSGLSFGSNFITSGGSLQVNSRYDGGVNSVSTATVNLSNTATGTIWGSYLASFSIGNANAGSFLNGIATGSDGANSSLKAGINSNTVPGDRKLTNGYDNSATASATGFLFAPSTTYLFISRFTNVGIALGGPTNGVATTWALTLAQYENWLATGATEAGLDSNYSLRVNDTATTGTFAFNNSGYLVLRSDAPDFNGATMNANVDELRFGTDLADIYAVPEPSVFSSLVLAAGVIGFSRRRRN